MSNPAPAAAARVQATQQEDLPEVCRFLHENLGRRFSADAWRASLTQSWAAQRPNFGMHLRHDGQVVGVICAIYSDQVIDGREVQVCNPHSWVVLEPYRSHSIGLLLPLLKQRGYQFTMLTPNPKVAKVFEGLRFRTLDDRLYHFPNLPGRGSIDATAAGVLARLQGADRRDFEAHAHLPWLHFAAFGPRDAPCLVIYKLTRWKRLPCAVLLHVSNPATLATAGGALRRHLLLRHRAVFSRVEGRFVQAAPPLTLRSVRGQSKLALSKELGDGQVRDLYSELVALDL